MLNSKTGDLLNRIVLENDPRGEILLLTGNSATTTDSHLNREYDTITVSGRNPSLIRGWSSETGILEFEWSLNLVNPNAANDVLWFYHKHFMYHVVPVWGSHIEMTGYIANSGQTTKNTATKISASWIKQESCLLVQQYFVCLIKNQLIVLDLVAESSNIKTISVEADENASIERVNGMEGVRVGNQIVLLGESMVLKTKLPKISSAYIEQSLGDNGVVIEISSEDTSIRILATDLQTGASIEELSSTASYPKTLGTPKILAVRCREKTPSQPAVCRLLLGTEDGSIVLLQQGKIKWTREEALTDIDAVEFLDLTLSDEEGELESELANKDGRFLFRFFLKEIQMNLINFY